MHTQRRPEAPHLLTRTEAAEILRVSLTTLSRITRAGQLQSVRVGRQVRIPADALQTYLSGSRPERGPRPEVAPDLSTWPPTESLLSQLNGYGELDPEQLDAAEQAAGLR